MPFGISTSCNVADDLLLGVVSDNVRLPIFFNFALLESTAGSSPAWVDLFMTSKSCKADAGQSNSRQLYRHSSSDHVEDVERYRWGGYHPVDLGDILNNKYKVVHKLGQGGFATIWLARDLKENRNVAIKILLAKAPHKELKLLTHLRDHGGHHPNIVSLQDAFTVEGPNGLHQCLVIDSVGPSLSRIADGEHHLSVRMARNAGQNIAGGLAHLHSKSIVHGGKKSFYYGAAPPDVALDLTSANILFEMENFNNWSEQEVYQHLGEPRTTSVRLLSGAAPGPSAPARIVEAVQYRNIDEKWFTGNVRIIDFGEAFFKSQPPAELLGTPASYFAPEMLFGRSASAASDVWALGCIIFELHALRPLILTFFGALEEGLAETVQTLGPLPKTWAPSYYDKATAEQLKNDHSTPLFNASELRHPLQSLVRKIEPSLTATDIAILLDLLTGALEYEPSHRLSAKQVATHAWFTE